MTGKELMVGDLVIYCKSNMYIARVREIRQTNDGEEMYISCDRDTRDTLYNDKEWHFFNCGILHPIRLTPEILLKNGFEKSLDDDGTHDRFTLVCGNVQFGVRFSNGVFQWTYPIDVRYVHELQHLLRFCGIEKEIEL